MVIVGDTHWKDKEPYYAGLKNFFRWLLETYPDETMIFTGDMFDTATPHFDTVYDVVIEYLLRFKAVHIVAGNHEEKFAKTKGNCLRPLRHHPTIHIYTRPTVVEIDKYSFWMLPFQYDYAQVKAYETAPLPKPVDFIICHATPQKLAFGDEGVNLRLKVSQVIWGHIHTPFEYRDDVNVQNIVIGVPQVTREGEQDFEKAILEFNPRTEKFEQKVIPVFMTIETVEYGEEPKSKDNLINVVNAPSIPAVYERYKGYYVNKEHIEVLRTDKEVVEEESKIFFNTKLEEQLVKYAEEKAVPKEMSDCILSYMEQVRS